MITLKSAVIIKGNKYGISLILNQDLPFEELKEENHSLKNTLEFWKDKFKSIIRFIKNKMLSKKDRDKYLDLSIDFYEHGIIEADTLKDQ